MQKKNNSLVVQRLNFFQRIRKSILLNNLSVEKYKKAPEYLKFDSEIIQKLVDDNPMNIQYVPDGYAIDYLGQNKELMEMLKKDVQQEYLEKKPELFSNLSEIQQTDYIFQQQKYEYIRFLSQEQQEKLLTQTNTFKSKPVDKTIDPTFLADKLEFFNEDVICKVIEYHKGVLNSRSNSSASMLRLEKSKKFYTMLKLQELPEELQEKIVSIDQRLVGKLSDEKITEFINGNPLLIDILPDDKKFDLIDKKPELSIMLAGGDKTKYQEHSPKAKMHKLYKRQTLEDTGINEDYFEILKTITNNHKTLEKGLLSESIFDLIPDEKLLFEVSKTIPEILYLNQEDLPKTRNLLLENITDNEIRENIEISKYFDLPITVEDNELTKHICKILTNKRVMSTVSKDKVIQFINNPDISLMKDIIIETYGENAKKILDSRPGLTMDNISNLKIFDEIIFENFGEAVIHNQLTYNTGFSFILADFVEHPEKIQEYKKFEEITQGFFPNNTGGNEGKYQSFMELYDLITQLDESEITEDRIHNLRQIILDLDFPESTFIQKNTIEDLDNYIVERNKMYDEAAKKSTSTPMLRNLLFKRFFGMEEFNKNSASIKGYKMTSMDIEGLMESFNIDSLLDDSRIYESKMFNDDELDMLGLMKAIYHIRDASTIKEMYEKLSESENILTPIDFESLRQKIPQHYADKLFSELLTPEKAKDMIERDVEGITSRIEDGINIFKMQGADFKIMLHAIQKNTLKMGQGSIEIPRDISADSLMKHFENGVSTISYSIIAPELLNTVGEGESIFLGYSNMDLNNFIAMNPTDALTSHDLRSENPGVGFVKMSYPEEFIEESRRVANPESKQLYKYNEVVGFRFEQELNKVSSQNAGGRILPDYIVVFGTATQEDIQRAKAFSKNGKPIPIVEIDKDAYLKLEENKENEQSGNNTKKVKDSTEIEKY